MAYATKLVLPHLLFGMECVHGFLYPLLVMKCPTFPPIIVEVVMLSVA